MLLRRDIIDISVSIGCSRDLTQKGMVQNEKGDVFCVASFGYPDGVYFSKGIKSPTVAYYCGVYSIKAKNRLDENNHETKKNIAVTKTDGLSRFIYLYEKIDTTSVEYFFHGRYKYVSYDFITSPNPEHDNEIRFKLQFIDRPQYVDIYRNKVRLY